MRRKNKTVIKDYQKKIEKEEWVDQNNLRDETDELDGMKKNKVCGIKQMTVGGMRQMKEGGRKQMKVGGMKQMKVQTV